MMFKRKRVSYGTARTWFRRYIDIGTISKRRRWWLLTGHDVLAVRPKYVEFYCVAKGDTLMALVGDFDAHWSEAEAA